MRLVIITVPWRRMSVALSIVRSDIFQNFAYGCDSRPTGKLSAGVELFAKSARFSSYMGFRSLAGHNTFTELHLIAGLSTIG